MSREMTNMSHEQKEEYVNKKVEEMRKKNEALQKRYEEVEADRLCAEQSNSSVIIASSRHSEIIRHRQNHDDWKAERERVDEERRIRASKNDQREWDLGKCEQGSEAMSEKRYRSIGRSTRQDISFSVQSRRYEEYKHHGQEQVEHHKRISHGSSQRIYQKNKEKVFAFSQKGLPADDSPNFTLVKQDKYKKIPYGSSQQHSFRHQQYENSDRVSHVPPKVFENKSKNLSYDRDEFEPKTFLSSGSRDNSYQSKNKHLSFHSNRRNAPTDRKPFKYQKSSYSGAMYGKPQTNQEENSLQELPKRGRSSYNEDGFGRVKQYSHTYSREGQEFKMPAISKSYSKSEFRKGDKGGGIVEHETCINPHKYYDETHDTGHGSAQQFSETWSDCEQADFNQGVSGTWSDDDCDKTIGHAVVEWKPPISETWSDYEQDDFNHGEPPGKGFSGSWSDDDECDKTMIRVVVERRPICNTLPDYEQDDFKQGECTDEANSGTCSIGTAQVNYDQEKNAATVENKCLKSDSQECPYDHSDWEYEELDLGNDNQKIKSHVHNASHKNISSSRYKISASVKNRKVHGSPRYKDINSQNEREDHGKHVLQSSLKSGHVYNKKVKSKAIDDTFTGRNVPSNNSDFMDPCCNNGAKEDRSDSSWPTISVNNDIFKDLTDKKGDDTTTEENVCADDKNKAFSALSGDIFLPSDQKNNSQKSKIGQDIATFIPHETANESKNSGAAGIKSSSELEVILAESEEKICGSNCITGDDIPSSFVPVATQAVKFEMCASELCPPVWENSALSIGRLGNTQESARSENEVSVFLPTVGNSHENVLSESTVSKKNSEKNITLYQGMVQEFKTNKSGVASLPFAANLTSELVPDRESDVINPEREILVSPSSDYSRVFLASGVEDSLVFDKVIPDKEINTYECKSSEGNSDISLPSVTTISVVDPNSVKTETCAVERQITEPQDKLTPETVCVDETCSAPCHVKNLGIKHG